MKRAEVVVRARSAIGHGCKYVLGAGGRNPQRTVPWDDGTMACDCSGFSCWARGMHRQVWIDTAREHQLATGQPAFLFRVPWAQALPGDSVTYPDWTDGEGKHREGHTGVVSEVNENGPSRVVHCSSGNWKQHSDAIQETGPELWLARGIVVRYGGLED